MTRCMGMTFRVISIVILFSLSCMLQLSARAQADNSHSFLDIKITPDRDSASEQAGQLRRDAQEIANLLGINPLVEKLRSAKLADQKNTASLPRALQVAKLLCLYKILIASEEVRKVVAQINFDLSCANSELYTLTEKYNATSNMLNTVNFMQGGILGITKNSMALANQSLVARQSIAMTSFGIGTTLPALNLFVPSLWTMKSESKANMLSHIFDTNFHPPDAKVSYLWKFFNSPVPYSASNLTRRQILVKHWEAFSGLHDNEKIQAKLTGTTEKIFRENIGLVRQRISLLQDMKTHIEEFDGALFELHQAISSENI